MCSCVHLRTWARMVSLEEAYEAHHQHLGSEHLKAPGYPLGKRLNLGFRLLPSLLLPGCTLASTGSLFSMPPRIPAHLPPRSEAAHVGTGLSPGAVLQLPSGVLGKADVGRSPWPLPLSYPSEPIPRGTTHSFLFCRTLLANEPSL